MQYLLLIYENEAQYNDMSPEQQGAVFHEYMEFSKSLAASGRMRGGEALEPVAKATTVRVRDGKTLTTDGPFAETREQLGGFYFIDAPDLDEAIQIATRIPGARTGSIEIRPVMIFNPT